MANFVRGISKNAKDFSELPEFIQNLANLVFVMNDKKGKIYNQSCSPYHPLQSVFFLSFFSMSLVGDGKWDIEEYRIGSVSWCRYVTDIAEVDSAYQTLLTVRFPISV